MAEPGTTPTRCARFLLLSAADAGGLPPVTHPVHADLVLDATCQGPTGVHRLYVGGEQGPVRVQNVGQARLLTWSMDVQPPAFAPEGLERWKRLEAPPAPGVHFVAGLCHDSGQALLASDALGAAPVFWARQPRWVAVANRLELLLGLDPALTRVSQLKLLSCWTLGHFLDDDFWTENVELFPGATVAAMDRGQARTRRYWDYQAFVHADPPPGAIDELAEVLRQTMADTYRMSPDAGILLSGGYHSRVLLAAGCADGRRPACLVVGPERLRDVTTASRVCARLSLPIERIEPDAGRGPAPQERLRRMSRITAGEGLSEYHLTWLAGAFEAIADRTIATGLGGSCIRFSNRRREISGHMSVETHWDDGRLQAQWRFDPTSAELAAADTRRVRTRVEEFLMDRIGPSVAQDGPTPVHVLLSRFFVLQRDRRGFGPARSYLQHHGRTVYPYLNQRVIELLGLLSGPLYEKGLSLVRELIGRLHPEALGVPPNYRIKEPWWVRVLQGGVWLASAGRVTSRPRWLQMHLMEHERHFKPRSATYRLWCETVDWADKHPELGLDTARLACLRGDASTHYPLAHKVLAWLMYAYYLKSNGISVSLQLPAGD